MTGIGYMKPFHASGKGRKNKLLLEDRIIE